ncbi:MAG: CBS domain-containing protein [Pseudolabrys sp.]
MLDFFSREYGCSGHLRLAVAGPCDTYGQTRIKNKENPVKIGEFLKHSRQRVVTCRPDDTLADVAKLLYAHGIGAMPVCETGQHMVGIISERDLVRVFARTDLSELQYIRARDIMTTRVVTCGPDDTMRGAQDLMRINHFRHLPVVDGGHVQGMLSLRDTLALRLQESEDEMKVLRDVVVAARH